MDNRRTEDGESHKNIIKIDKNNNNKGQEQPPKKGTTQKRNMNKEKRGGKNITRMP